MNATPDTNCLLRSLARHVTPLLAAAALVGLSACKEQPEPEPIADSAMEKLEEVEELGESNRQEMLRQLDEQGYIEVDPEIGAAATEALAEAADLAEGENKLGLEVLANFSSEFQQQAAEFQAAVDAFIESGGIQFGPGLTSEDLQARRALLNEFGQMNQEFIGTIENALDDLRTRFDEAGVSDEYTRDTVAGFAASFKQELLIQIRECDTIFVEESHKLLDILESVEGRFSFDDTGTLMLDEDVPDEILESYNTAIDLINAQVVRQTELQRAYFSN